MSSCFTCHIKLDSILKCAVCLENAYCSKVCQKKDWTKGHNISCGLTTKQRIYSASFRGKPDELTKLLSDYPKLKLDWVNPQCGGTAVYAAAQEGHHHCLSMLSERDADLTQKSSNGLEPIHVACWLDRPECLRVLLASGKVRPDTQTLMKSPGQDSQEIQTPFLICLFRSHLACLSLLYEYGLDPNSVDRLGRGHIHLAAYYGLEKVIKLAVSNGGNINLTDAQGYTPLDLALATKRNSATAELIKSLSGLSTHDPNRPLIIIGASSDFPVVLSSKEAMLSEHESSLKKIEDRKKEIKVLKTRSRKCQYPECTASIDSKLWRCAGCSVATYCSESHQTLHWLTHHPFCVKLSISN